MNEEQIFGAMPRVSVLFEEKDEHPQLQSTCSCKNISPPFDELRRTPKFIFIFACNLVRFTLREKEASIENTFSTKQQPCPCEY